MRGTIGVTRGRRVLFAGRARAVFGVCLAVAVALVAPAAAAAAPPATLTGEELSVSGIASVLCQQSGTVSCTASGTATGLYPGTFTETGTAAGTSTGSVTSLSASFTINSPGGAVLVKGTTTANSGEWCQNTSGATFLRNSPGYQATIFAASGNYSDQGSIST